MAFGLFTLLSSSLIGFSQVMLSIIILLSDHQYSIVFCLMVASFYLFLQIPFPDRNSNKRYVFILKYIIYNLVQIGVKKLLNKV